MSTESEDFLEHVKKKSTEVGESLSAAGDAIDKASESLIDFSRLDIDFYAIFNEGVDAQ